MPGYADIQELAGKTCHCSMGIISSPEAESTQPEAEIDLTHVKLSLVGIDAVCATQNLVASPEKPTMGPVSDA